MANYAIKTMNFSGNTGTKYHFRDDSIQYGYVQDITVDSDGLASSAVTFPTAYSSSPRVMLTVNGKTKPLNWAVSTSGLSTTGFTINVQRDSSSSDTDVSVAWLAIGSTSADS